LKLLTLLAIAIACFGCERRPDPIVTNRYAANGGNRMYEGEMGNWTVKFLGNIGDGEESRAVYEFSDPKTGRSFIAIRGYGISDTWWQSQGKYRVKRED